MTRAHKKATTILAALLGVLAIASTAYAATHESFALGGPGKRPKLAADCSRRAMYLTPADKTWEHGGKQFVFAGFSVYQNQIDCLIVRVNHVETAGGTPPPGSCWANPVPVVTQIHRDDWTGVDALRAYVAAVRSCELGGDG
jgi:hypothetical protein